MKIQFSGLPKTDGSGGASDLFTVQEAGLVFQREQVILPDKVKDRLTPDIQNMYESFVHTCFT